MATPKPVWIRYTFTLADTSTRIFEVNLDPETYQIIRPPQPGPPPEWTKQSFSPCDHCALPTGTEHCPIAVNLAYVSDAFRSVVNSKSVEVVVETAERRYTKKGSSQETLFPLLGLFMTASGCPSMSKLKPLVSSHLPFASVDETIYRVLTMYVMAQYLRMQDGLEPDWDLAGINEIYDHMNKVNVSFCQRLTKASGEDALVNSLVILDMVGSLVKMPTPENVEKIRGLFEPYLQGPKKP